MAYVLAIVLLLLMLQEAKTVKTKLMAMLLLAGGALVAQPRLAVGVQVGGPGYYPAVPAPPAMAYVPPCPGPGYVWIDGYYDPYGSWVGGYWALPPYAGAYWVGPRFAGGHFYSGYWGGARYYGGGVRGYRAPAYRVYGGGFDRGYGRGYDRGYNRGSERGHDNRGYDRGHGFRR